MDRPLILLLETATDRCSVGLSEGEQMLAQFESDKPFAHTAQITLLIQQVLDHGRLEMSALQAVAVSSGPGSYTALRVGSATAKGLCYSLSIPLIAVPTLFSLAVACRDKVEGAEAWFAPMIDARRDDVYWQLFGQDMKAAGALEMRTLQADMLPHDDKPVYVCGNAADKADKLLAGLVHPLNLACEARWLAKPAVEAFNHGQFADIAYFEPAYVTAPNITKPKKTW